MVTPEMRARAKAVNFGIVYGQTPFGLAASLGIDRKEAETYIRTYFELYAGVRKFIDKTIAEVRESGFARTLFGRKRPIPDMQQPQSECAVVCRADCREYAAAGHGCRSDQARDDPHRRRTAVAQTADADAAAGA